MQRPTRIPGPPGTARRYTHDLPPLPAAPAAIPSASLRNHLPDLRPHSPPTNTLLGSAKSWRADAGSEYSIGTYEAWKTEREAKRQARKAAGKPAKRAKKARRIDDEYLPLFTTTEELWMTKHEQLLESDAFGAEAYALSALWSSAERESPPSPRAHPHAPTDTSNNTGIVDARLALANGASDCERCPARQQARPARSQAAKEQRRAAREARLARQMGRPALSAWATVYVDTYGALYGFPRVLVESLGEGEGVLEFGG